MVCILHNCDCKTCNGGIPAPKGSYGGSKCVCLCHQLEGKDKDDFINSIGDIKKRAKLFQKLHRAKHPEIFGKEE